MRTALISTILAVATSVVALPGHSPLSLTDAKHDLVRRNILGSSSALQAVPNLVAREEDPPTAGSIICGLLKEEPLKGIVQAATTLWDEIQKDPEVAPEVNSLTTMVSTIVEDIIQAGNKNLDSVKKSLTKDGGALGAEIVASIEKIVQDIETAVPALMLEVMGCVSSSQEENPEQ